MVNGIPLPEQISVESRSNILTIVNSILKLKNGNPGADSKDLESALNSVVYSIYELSPEEIALIESKK
jgi:hypothetical protein